MGSNKKNLAGMIANSAMMMTCLEMVVRYGVAVIVVITSYSIHYTKLYDTFPLASLTGSWFFLGLPTSSTAVPITIIRNRKLASFGMIRISELTGLKRFLMSYNFV